MRRHTKSWSLSLLAILAILGAVAASVAEAEKIKIVLVGNSTVTDNAGWGLGFKQFLTGGAMILPSNNPAEHDRCLAVQKFQSELPKVRWTKQIACC